MEIRENLMKTILKYSVATFVLMALPLTANAQFARNNSAPIDATADSIVNSGGTTILTGQVDVRQGDVRILADQMKIYGAGNGSGSSAANDISKIEAFGNFYYITPDQEVRGNNGVYQQSTDTFTVTGDVILLQDDNIVTGETLIYNLTTEQAKVVGTCKGRKCGAKGRVKILIKNTSNQAAS
jgi:lipopolysaccharide export system protein LptA